MVLWQLADGDAEEPWASALSSLQRNPSVRGVPYGTAPSRWKRDGIKQNKSRPKGFASFSSHVSMGGLKATARAVWLDWAVSDLESSAGIYQLTKSPVRIHWWWPRSLSTASKQWSPAGFRYEVVQSWERYSGQSRLISYHSSSRRRGQYHKEPPNVTGDVLSATITDNGSKTLDLKLMPKSFPSACRFVLGISSGRFGDQRFLFLCTEKECVKGCLKIQAGLRRDWPSASSSTRSMTTSEAVHRWVKETVKTFESSNWS